MADLIASNSVILGPTKSNGRGGYLLSPNASYVLLAASVNLRTGNNIFTQGEDYQYRSSSIYSHSQGQSICHEARWLLRESHLIWDNFPFFQGRNTMCCDFFLPLLSNFTLHSFPLRLTMEGKTHWANERLASFSRFIQQVKDILRQQRHSGGFTKMPSLSKG